MNVIVLRKSESCNNSFSDINKFSDDVIYTNFVSVFAVIIYPIFFVILKFLSFFFLSSILVLGIIRLAQLDNAESVVTPETTISELSLIFDLEGDNGSPLEEKKNVVCDTKECHIIGS